ncbi:MAG TPA: hypothetical protein V6D26_26235 [Stenomitos sp.]
MHQPKFRRNRGVILTSQGWNKLQAAKSEAELDENSGYRYTLEELSERTNLSVDTLHRVNTCSVTVDKQTLMRYFSTFNLKLEPDDYFRPEFQTKDDVEKLPGGQVPLDSADYMGRSATESRTYEAKSSVESATSSSQEQKQAKTEDISPFSNLFNISSSTIKNVSGSGTINYYESAEASQSRAVAKVRGRVVKVGYSRRSDDIGMIQTAQRRGV